MHDTAFRIGELVMRTYSDMPGPKILEVGSFNVNGCLRDAAPPTASYVGLDIDEGPSVDFVITPGADFPVEDDSFDLVMASSVFEHDSRFWETFLRMCRAARPGGHVYVNAPSNGAVHRYPRDCWRFYPDAGLALAEYARSEGVEVDLIESFVGDRHTDCWNDFVAIFRRGPSAEPLNTSFVHQRYPSLNARTWQSPAIHNESALPEDMAMIQALRERCDGLSGQTAELEQTRAALAEERAQKDALAGQAAQLPAVAAELEQIRAALAGEQAQKDALIEQAARLSEAVAGSEARGLQAAADNAALAQQTATLESNLLQRREEIAQAWADSEALTAERDLLRGRIDETETIAARLGTRLAKADEWVFTLAGERHMLERRTTRLRSDLEQVRRSIAKAEALADVRQRQADEQRAINDRVRNGLARLRIADETPEANVEATASLYREWQEGAHPLAEVAALLDAGARARQAGLEREAALRGDLHRLAERIEKQEGAHRAADERIVALTQAEAVLRAENLACQETAAQALAQVEALRAENDRQAAVVRTLEERVARQDGDLTWLQRLYELIEPGDGRWQALLPHRTQRQRLLRNLREHGHFDGDAYLTRYPDVAAAEMDPLRHYIQYGLREGRVVDVGQD